MELYNTCNGVKSSNPEGLIGADALVYLPMCCYWNASGKQFTFPNAEIPQKASRPIQGYTRPNDFVKNAPSCNFAWGVI